MMAANSASRFDPLVVVAVVGPVMVG
jgi:hypothetical protein